jgi:hypothetical protein
MTSSEPPSWISFAIRVRPRISSVPQPAGRLERVPATGRLAPTSTPMGRNRHPSSFPLGSMTFPHHHEGCPLAELSCLFRAQRIHERSTKDNHGRVALRRPLVVSTRGWRPPASSPSLAWGNACGSMTRTLVRFRPKRRSKVLHLRALLVH